MTSVKLYVSLLLFGLVLFSCSNETITDRGDTNLIGQENPPVITFEEPVFNFGNVVEGQVVQKLFHFTNTGKSPLVISDVNASCGCTVPKNWPKQPIAPGEKAYVEVNFNTEGRVGTANKIITVTANTQPTNTNLTIKGTVVGPTISE